MGKERYMTTKDKLYGTAENIKPYVDRAMSDEKLREDLLRAFKTARGLYADLMGDREQPVRIATRVATDDEVRDRLRDAIEDLRRASDRLQGKREHTGRNTTLLIAGIALGLLLNPVTGPETRRFIKDMLTGGSRSEADASSDSSSNGRT
jgi:hypothetical protein